MKYAPRTLPQYVINSFFILGAVSGLAFRSIIVFNHLNPSMVRPVWYCGVIGYIFFFLYRYAISQRRKRAVSQYDLISKIQAGEKLSDEDKRVAVYLLSSIEKSRENLNYLFIFILSITAVILDILLSMLIS